MAGPTLTGSARSVSLERVRPSLEAEWELLAERAAATPVLRPWWFRVLYEHVPLHGDLLAVTVRSEGRLTALLPLLRHGPVLRGPTSWDTPGFGILAESDAAADAAAEAVVRLPSRRVDLGFLRDRDLERFERAARSNRRWVLSRPLEAAPYVDLSPGWEGVEQALSRNFRQFTRRRTRQLERAGEVEVEQVTAPEQVPEAVEEAFRLEASGWKGEQGSAALNKPRQYRFYMALARAAAEQGYLALHFLKLDGERIAMCLSLEGDGTYHLMKTAYDESYGKFSPGQVLMRALVKDAAERGLQVFDFLGGTEGYKRRWTDLIETRSRFQAFSRTPAGFVDRAAWAYGRPLAKRAIALTKWRPGSRPGEEHTPSSSH